MSLYRKKPVIIEALRWTGENINEMHAWLTAAGVYDRCSTAVGNGEMTISTLEGTMTANAGDWIIKGVQGEVYPVRNDIFEQTYEAVE